MRPTSKWLVAVPVCAGLVGLALFCPILTGCGPRKSERGDGKASPAPPTPPTYGEKGPAGGPTGGRGPAGERPPRSGEEPKSAKPPEAGPPKEGEAATGFDSAQVCDEPPGGVTRPAPAGSRFPVVVVGANGDSYRKVTVFYATDREGTGPDRARTYASRQREDTEGDIKQGRGVEYGIVEVAIPWQRHRPGDLDEPGTLALHPDDPTKYTTVLAAQRRDPETFAALVAGDPMLKSGGDLLVFVHGYNVSFDAAARRTAQILYDLSVAGAPVSAAMYDWSSHGEYRDYVADTHAVDGSAPRLAAFLRMLAQQTTASRIHIIAHSMGSQVAGKALAILGQTGGMPTKRRTFSTLVLAAPDITTKLFAEEVYPSVMRLTDRRAIYASSKDWALKASKQVADERILGLGGGKVRIFTGIDTIDCSCLCGFFELGHSYFADKAQVLDDISDFVFGRKPIADRALHEVPCEAGKYWSFCP